MVFSETARAMADYSPRRLVHYGVSRSFFSGLHFLHPSHCSRFHWSVHRPFCDGEAEADQGDGWVRLPTIRVAVGL